MQAVEPTYMKILRDVNTNTITCDIPTILNRLFTNYGLIEDKVLSKTENKIRTMQYNLLDPLVKVFDNVEELHHLGHAAQDPYFEAQLIKFSLQIIKNTHDFETGILTWIKLPRASKTWAIFKTYFESAHCSLRKIRGNKMRSSSFNQVNMVLAEVNNVRESVLSAISEASEPVNDEE